MNRTSRLAALPTAVVGLALVATLGPGLPAAAGEPVLRPEVHAPERGNVGGELFLQVMVRNETDAAVEQVVVDVVVPSELGQPQAEPARDELSLQCAGSRCTAPRLEPWDTAVVSFRTTPTSTGTHTVRATVPARGEHPAVEVASQVEVAEALAPGRFTLDRTSVHLRPDAALALSGVLKEPGGQAPDPYGLTLWRAEPGTGRWEPAHWSPRPWAEDAPGAFSTPVDTSSSGDYQWRHRGTATMAATTSEVVRVRVVGLPGLAVDPVRVPPGGLSWLTATVSGDVAGRTVAFERWDGSSWSPVATRTVTGPGAVRVALGTRPLGTHRYRATLSGEAGGSTAARTLTVTTTGKGDPGAFAFTGRTRTGQPVRWNPCVPIRYAFNPASAPPGAAADLTEALRRVSLASGLVFRSVGRTSHLPRDLYRDRQPTDLVIAWARPRQSPLLPPGPAGVGATLHDGRRILKGAVVLDATLDLRGGFGEDDTLGALLMHELGHAVGLGHPDPRREAQQVMGYGQTEAAVWGAGDLNGLKRVGRSAGCLS